MSYTVPCFGHQFRRSGCFPALLRPSNWCKQDTKNFPERPHLPRYRLLSHKKLSFFVKAPPSKKMTTFYDYKQKLFHWRHLQWNQVLLKKGSCGRLSESLTIQRITNTGWLIDSNLKQISSWTYCKLPFLHFFQNHSNALLIRRVNGDQLDSSSYSVNQ